ncbi:GIY-YIG nuclease family protein [Paenibacillus sp. GCM10012306]|uniref:GIY-YIG nuclease family protein n=1 Tax=Paenibacillus sp. GCM10012306 TaxID=3317342 RepID=UPI00360E6C17
MNLTEKVKNLPMTPGVYLMKDSLGNIIYVGKAKALKRRVQSYFQDSNSHSPKVKRLVKNIRDLDYTLTDTEFEAFMLECTLIKELKPPYNKKMKNPLAYTYIVIRTDGQRRRIEVTPDLGDGAERSDGRLFFGPYTSRSTVERAIQGVLESYSILCSNPHSKKASLCLNHSLGLCIGMCAGGEALTIYNRIMDDFVALLDGTDLRILEGMEQRMAAAAENYNFEVAAKYRDYIGAVRSLLQKEKVIEFAGANQRIAMVEPINDQILKLLLLQGNRILFQTKLELEYFRNASLQAEITTIIKDVFRGHNFTGSAAVSRYEIDEAQIIYSYLKGSSCNHIIVSEEWLAPENDTVIDDAVREMLLNCYAV